MIGFSAGAHLTAAAAQKEPKQNFSILIYPAYLHQPSSFNLAKNIIVNADTPPAFIAQAQDDKRYYRSALAYALALDEAGVSTELHLHARGGHGYGSRDLGHPAHQWPTLCEAWLRDQNILSPSD
jgi:acetyl esterase/lipase